MNQKIKALTLNHIKYSETSIILNIYTVEYGYLSLLIKGFYGKKKKIQACLYPFTEIEFILTSNTDKEKLITTYSVDILNYFDHIFSNPIKTLQVQLLAEIMVPILKQEPGNDILFQKLEENLTYFDQKESHFADFHLFFIKDIADQLGLKPNLSNKNGQYFNLKESQFFDIDTEDMNVDLEASILIKKLFVNEFNHSSNNIFNQQQRNILLNVLLKYFEFHIPNFQTPKSLEIIKALLN